MTDSEATVLIARWTITAADLEKPRIEDNLPVFRRLSPDIEKTVLGSTTDSEYLTDTRVPISRPSHVHKKALTCRVRVAKILLGSHLLSFVPAALFEQPVVAKRPETLARSEGVDEIQ
jgi:hypothetical protein